MKRKQETVILTALILVISLLAGCAFLPTDGGAADTPAPEAAAAESASAEAEASAASEAPEVPEAPQEPAAAAPVKWSGIYRDFLLGGGYLVSGQTYEEGNPRFGIYDLDHNGVPELFATRGAMALANTEQYVYTIENNAVRFLGNAGHYESGFEYVKDARYPGLFNIWFHGGSGGVSYLAMVNGAYKETPVMEFQDGMEYTYTQLTDDDALYQFARDFYQPYSDVDPAKGGHLPMYTISEIESMGWDAFAGGF